MEITIIYSSAFCNTMEDGLPISNMTAFFVTIIINIDKITASPNITVHPCFNPDFALSLSPAPRFCATNTSASYPDMVSPASLDPRNEIFLPWNPEFQTWHDYWFGSSMQYHSYIDQMSLLEYFLSWKNTWAIAPFSVADPISKLPYISTHQLDAPLSDRTIYYVKKVNREIRFEQIFLHALKEELSKSPDYTVLFTA